ncbi:hypothetical protein [Brevibacillus daliensis]|uniref:hypothetical protein n=1 Tax=Brevibacillus daliensis TaxID=2892995 RepID=UPI001E3CC4BB|nr:hypothetical protein [Brevibacillus daliensis]
MSDTNEQIIKEITITTQAFLILCRLFDGYYDELTKNDGWKDTVETTAQVLLNGVSILKEQETQPKHVILALPFPSLFLLKKLVEQSVADIKQAPEQVSAVAWLEECLQAFTEGMTS